MDLPRIDFIESAACLKVFGKSFSGTSAYILFNALTGTVAARSAELSTPSFINLLRVNFGLGFFIFNLHYVITL
jgi:hypothetical protein